MKLPKEREHLVTDNIKLVGYVIQKDIQPKSTDLYEDLFQEGCVYLIKAAIRFDESKGNKFTSYAYQYILRGMQKYITENLKTSGIHYSPKVIKTLYPKYLRLLNTGMYTEQEIADMMGISIDTLIMINSIGGTISDTVCNSDGEEISIFDLMPDKSSNILFNSDIELDELMNAIDDILRTRSEMRIKMYKEYLLNKINGKELNISELAKKYNLTYGSYRTIMNQTNTYVKKELIKREFKE